jgi:hypothetical protein
LNYDENNDYEKNKVINIKIENYMEDAEFIWHLNFKGRLISIGTNYIDSKYFTFAIGIKE